MKQIFSLLITFCTLTAFGQYPVSSINITIQNNPPANTADWVTATPSLMITAQAKLVQGKMDPRVQEGRVLFIIKKNGSKFCGSFNQQTAPLANFSSASKSYSGAVAVGLLGNACVLPAGEYQLCVQFFSSYAPIEALSAEACKTFTIAGPRQESHSAPRNMKPVDGKVFSIAEANLPVTFNWLGVLPKPTTDVIYKLRIVEWRADQSSQQALQMNTPIDVIEVKNITNTTYRLAQKYNSLAWDVTAISAEGVQGAPPRNYGKSEATVVFYKEDEDAKIKEQNDTTDSAPPKSVMPVDGKVITKVEQPKIKSTDAERATQSSCCQYTASGGFNPPNVCESTSGNYKVYLDFFTTTAPCTAHQYYQLDGVGSWILLPSNVSFTYILISTTGPHTIKFKLLCSDGTTIYRSYQTTFTILRSTLSAAVCDYPSGSINKGCVKKFNIVDPTFSSCPATSSSPVFPTACGTTFQFMVYQSFTAPPSTSYPVPSTISSIPFYPPCAYNEPHSTWYRIPNDPNNPANINLRSAPMPDLTVNLPTEHTYVICYITNSSTCCIPSGYAIVCPAFQILNPPPPPPNMAYVRSPILYPPTDYHQCCNKEFVLNKNSTGPVITSITGASYQWVILKGTTNASVIPGCLADVLYDYPTPSASCPDPPLLLNDMWYKFGTNSVSQFAPHVPAGSNYSVSCYIQVPCTNTTYPSHFAMPQQFNVLLPTAPPPAVITVHDPSGLSTITTNSAGNSTLNICTLPAANITLTSSVQNNYLWSTGQTVQSINLSTVGTYNETVSYTTTNANYPSPGCIVTSKLMTVKIKNCPCTNCAFSINNNIHATCTGRVGGIAYYTISFDITNNSGCNGSLSLSQGPPVGTGDLLTFTTMNIHPGLTSNVTASFKDTPANAGGIGITFVFINANGDYCEKGMFVSLSGVVTCP